MHSNMNSQTNDSSPVGCVYGYFFPVFSYLFNVISLSKAAHLKPRSSISFSSTCWPVGEYCISLNR